MGLRIRKLTPKECLKLMGFTEEDYNAMKEIGMSDSAIYHCAGDSAVVTIWLSLIEKVIDNSNDSHISLVENYVENCVVNK